MIILLFAVGVLAGALNAVAGGGAFFVLPTLLYAGVTPVAANATSAFAVWPGSLSSAIAYRRDIQADRATIALLAGVSMAGGLAGALLLVDTSDTSFMRLLPWLMAIATATFTFGDRLIAQLDPDRRRGGHRVSALGLLLQLAIAVYGGYFGGGMGIMMLATLSIAGMTDIHEMNGLKAVLGTAINGVAVAAFIVHRAIAWAPGLAVMAGAITGGYGGAALARRIDRRVVRLFVVVVGWAMTIYFFAR